ncbi:MAG: hypothetical protein A4E52_00920 [Pelotomaculum sp. PtaB.Bin013]|uniref:Uncharacterized protein n=1 Tax=Pelotomaculum isophthalicicum JI TaxID=947010 RepID=A0A9X4H6G0_9FIRM|nr:hypothetical protein [Pelotomaculum isophthalicicum]MDF9408444.1 hypothetical protein [Pelotomaculum isophthalicicum JI]OPX89807.1 MAG: hypothetical protein A4E52_00920 [Pelotomaculum sp. PtaB.Bin013]
MRSRLAPGPEGHSVISGNIEDSGLRKVRSLFLQRERGLDNILITAGAEGNHKSEQYNVADALAVYNSIRK